MTGLRAKAVILGSVAEAALSALEADNRPEAGSIRRRVLQCKSLLLSDPLHGEVVKKGSLPRALAEKHDIDNVYVENLPNFWRLLYSLTRDGASPLVTIIEIVDHPTYSKWFPGRGR